MSKFYYRVKVKPNSRENKAEKVGDCDFIVKVKASAKKNKANFAVMEVLADYFKIPISNIRLILGRTSKNKIIEISGL
ncbi:DUF167 domain-containing protein [Candidatus Wolfebacteria bacterium]|nr:DUF167 domain-containing protein [Candidatus Wolfebacteria bacterium]